MAYMKIYCDSCGGTWEVYARGNWIDERYNEICPHCGKKIDAQTWKRQVVPAFCVFQDTEKELYKDHANHKPLFTVDFIADAIYKNAKDRDRTSDDD